MGKVAFPRSMRVADPVRLSSAIVENMRYLENLLNQTFNFDHDILSNIGVDDHHVKYTDAEVDAIVATHDAIAAAHHAKYLDSEAVTAMGVLGDGNPLNHDRPVPNDWDTYTPTFTGFTLGNGTIDMARFIEIDGVVFLKISVTLGSTSAVTGGNIEVSLPVAAANLHSKNTFGAHYLESGVQNLYGSCQVGANGIRFVSLVASGTYVAFGATSSTVPFTWGVNDTFHAAVWYEV